MQNEKEPAYPYVDYLQTHYEDNDNHYGLSKLELGTFMILQGFASGVREPISIKAVHLMAKEAAELAKLGLDAANNII